MSSGDVTFVLARLSVAYTDPLPCDVAAAAVAVLARSSNPKNWNPAWHFSNNRTPAHFRPLRRIAHYRDDLRLD